MTEPDRTHRPGDDAHVARPSFRQLLDWVEGRPSPGQIIEALVDAEDDETVAAVDWIRGFLRFSGENPLPPVPPAVRQRLHLAFERHHGRESVIVRETATRSFDSRNDALLTGVRGSPGATHRYRLAFATESHGVLMDVTTDAAGLAAFEGQVLTGQNEAVVWEVTAHHPNGAKTDVLGKLDGCFSISDVPADCSSLVLSNGRMEIEIPDPLGSDEGKSG